MNRLGQRQNLWDKAQEARKEGEIHPLLRGAGVTAGMGTMAEQTGQGWRANAPFRHQAGSGEGWGGACETRGSLVTRGRARRPLAPPRRPPTPPDQHR